MNAVMYLEAPREIKHHDYVPTFTRDVARILFDLNRYSGSMEHAQLDEERHLESEQEEDTVGGCDEVRFVIDSTFCYHLS